MRIYLTNTTDIRLQENGMPKFDEVMKEIEAEQPRYHDRAAAPIGILYPNTVFRDKRMQSPLTQLMFADMKPKKLTIISKIKYFLGRVKSAYHYFKHNT